MLPPYRLCNRSLNNVKWHVRYLNLFKIQGLLLKIVSLIATLLKITCIGCNLPKLTLQCDHHRSQIPNACWSNPPVKSSRTKTKEMVLMGKPGSLCMPKTKQKKKLETQEFSCNENSILQCITVGTFADR